MHGEIDLCGAGYGEQVQYSVGRAAHGDVKGHRVKKGFFVRDGTREHGIIPVKIIRFRVFDNEFRGLFKERYPVFMGRDNRAVPGKGHADRFGEAVH